MKRVKEFEKQQNKGCDFFFPHSLIATIHYSISNNYFIWQFLNKHLCLLWFRDECVPFERTFLGLQVHVTSCLRAACATFTVVKGPHLPQGLWCWREGTWELRHLAVFGHRFLLAFPQCSEWQSFSGCAATCTNRHTHTQTANLVNNHLHFGLSVVPLCSQQQLNLITPQQNTFHWVPLSLSFAISLPFSAFQSYQW